MRITVIGAGYVSLVAAACFAELGNDVLCVDADAAKIGALQHGHVQLFEAGLSSVVQRNMQLGRLRFARQLEQAGEGVAIHFIAVNTPMGDDGTADISAVLAAARDIAQSMASFTLIVIKSTVPVGTTERVTQEIARHLGERGAACLFEVASNPEFLREGSAVADFMHPDRIVIGVSSTHAATLLRQVYAQIQAGPAGMLCMDPRSAELTKYAANAMLATRVSLINELAKLAASLGADIEQVRVGIGSDMRIGPHYLQAGIGYGGSCFPKDISALRAMGRCADVDMEIVGAVERVNDRQQLALVTLLTDRLGRQLQGKRFAIWGLSFKPGTDDMRCAPSLQILARLWALGAQVSVYDPAAMAEAARIFGPRDDLHFAHTALDALEGADALLLLTDWPEFAHPDFARMKSLLHQALILDGRNLYDPVQLRACGFEYVGIGRVAPSAMHAAPHFAEELL